MTDEFKQMVIDTLRRGNELPRDWARSQVSDLFLSQEAAIGKTITRPVRATVIRVLQNKTVATERPFVKSTIVVSLN